MYLLHQIGPRINSNHNTLEEILASEGPISFDGVYESVYQNYKALKGKDVTFFVIGKYVGDDNSFDVGQPLSRFCTWAQIFEMVDYLDAKLGYHSWSHQCLIGLDHQALVNEIVPPGPLDFDGGFAYPAGRVDEKVADVARFFYGEAWSVFEGDGSTYQKHRKYLNW